LETWDIAVCRLADNSTTDTGRADEFLVNLKRRIMGAPPLKTSRPCSAV